MASASSAFLQTLQQQLTEVTISVEAEKAAKARLDADAVAAQRAIDSQIAVGRKFALLDDAKCACCAYCLST